MNMTIKIFITGGTFDKEYDELEGKLFLKDTHLHEMLTRGRCRLKIDICTLMMVDSCDMTDTDRKIILANCKKTPEDRILMARTKWLRLRKFLLVPSRIRRLF